MNQEEQRSALRLLLGALYSKCGFTHFWRRKQRNMRYPSRYEALLASSTELDKYGISNEDLRFLVGPWSPYWPLGNSYVQESPKPLLQAAEVLRSISQKPAREESARVFLSVWRFVTQTDSYDISGCMNADKLFLTEDGMDDVDIYGEVDLKKFHEEMREHGVEI